MNSTYLTIALLAPPAGYGIARALEDYRARRRSRAYWRREHARAIAARDRLYRDPLTQTPPDPVDVAGRYLAARFLAGRNELSNLDAADLELSNLDRLDGVRRHPSSKNPRP